MAACVLVLSDPQTRMKKNYTCIVISYIYIHLIFINSNRLYWQWSIFYRHYFLHFLYFIFLHIIFFFCYIKKGYVNFFDFALFFFDNIEFRSSVQISYIFNAALQYINWRFSP